MFNALRTFARGHARLIGLLCGGCLVVFLSSQSGLRDAAAQTTTGTPAARTFRVVGTLTLMVGGDRAQAVAQIELPDTEVSLQNASSDQVVSKAKTQLDGKFYLQAPSSGTYLVCWNAPGIGPACGSKFVVLKQDVFLSVVPVRPQSGVIYGKVLTADGRPCWVNDSFFKLDVSTSVALLGNTGQPLRPAIRANIAGEYGFAGVRADNRYIVRAECEKAAGQATVSMGASPATANITLPNHAPRIAAVAAFDSVSGKGITRVASGSIVKVGALARDPDQDNVEYLWRLLGGNGSIPSTSSAQQDWQLSAKPGLHTLYLMARDGKGGYAYKRFDLQVGAQDVGFSGRVIDENSQVPVVDASVKVNGVSTRTDAQGWFSLTAPFAPDAERYVMNISHRDYALLSRIHDKGSAGNTYELIRVQTTTHNPARLIDVVDTSSGGPCGSPGGKQPARTGTLQSMLSTARLGGVKSADRYQYGEPKPCSHRGAHVVLPAGVLVGADRKPAQGPVKMAFATLNMARRSLPGDYRAIGRNLAPTELLTFGALFAGFRDANDKPLHLKPGSRAEIRVPVSNEQLPFAKPTIAVWSYDEKRGLWVEEGRAVLRNTAEGWMYVGTTTHFSVINMDVAGNDPAQATCVRFELGNSLTAWSNLVIRSYVSYAGSFSIAKETPWDGAQYNAIYRIPFSPPATGPNTLRLEVRGTYNGQEVVLLNNVINTDARPKMTGNNLWPPYPYTECGDVITLEADSVTLPYYGDIDATGRPAFLTGPYGEFLSENGEQTATDYYNTIDGNNDYPTLSSWWSNHGFSGVDGSGGTAATYLNNNDLGFGRDMNCKTTGNDLACFVTNYGAPDQNPDNADAATNHVAAKRGATVAMEYKDSEPADRQVRFYVYGGGDPATATKLKFADLDGLGPKSVPHLCIVCHGGSFSAGTTNNALQARFREFDLPSFKYSNARSWDYGSNTLTPAELTAFASLNKMIRDVAPATSPIKDLINNWYPGNNFGPGVAPVQPAVPAGWNTEVNNYHNVFGKSCRTCHVARDGGVADNYITFPDSATFAAIAPAKVCGLPPNNQPKVMPNAYVTYKNFWSDLQRVIDFRSLTGQQAATCQ